jgi:hypothetical protein
MRRMDAAHNIVVFMAFFNEKTMKTYRRDRPPVRRPAVLFKGEFKE